MADRTTNKIYKTKGGFQTEAYRIADGVTLGVGALVQTESGYLNHWDESGDFIGIVVGGTDRARDGVIIGETSDTPPPEAIVAIGATLMHVAVAGTVTIADVGELVYSADSDPASLTKTDTTNPPVGRIVRVHSAGIASVQLFTPSEWKAGDAGAAWAS